LSLAALRASGLPSFVMLTEYSFSSLSSWTTTMISSSPALSQYTTSVMALYWMPPAKASASTDSRADRLLAELRLLWYRVSLVSSL